MHDYVDCMVHRSESSHFSGGAPTHKNEAVWYPRAPRELPIDVVARAIGGDAALGHTVPEEWVARVQREHFGEAVERAQRIAAEQKLHAYATNTCYNYWDQKNDIRKRKNSTKL